MKTIRTQKMNQTSLRLPREMVAKIRAIAKAEHRSVNGQINAMLADQLGLDQAAERK